MNKYAYNTVAKKLLALLLTVAIPLTGVSCQKTPDQPAAEAGETSDAVEAVEAGEAAEAGDAAGAVAPAPHHRVPERGVPRDHGGQRGL